MQLLGLYRRVANRPDFPGGSSAHATACPEDRVRCQSIAECPTRLWIADLTHVPTWAGLVYTAFVIDVFVHRIVRWRTARNMTTNLVLNALKHALYAQSDRDDLIYHSDRRTQYLSIRYTDRLQEAGIEGSVGSTGDSYDNALSESIMGLYETEVIHRRGPQRNLDDVEYATVEWVDWV